jgi:hypothetical protein
VVVILSARQLAGPAYQERHPHSTFIYFALGAAQRGVAGRVPDGTAVVAEEKNQGAGLLVRVGQSRRDLPDGVVQQTDLGGIVSPGCWFQGGESLRAFGRRLMRGMRRVEREIQKPWVIFVPADEGRSFLAQGCSQMVGYLDRFSIALQSQRVLPAVGLPVPITVTAANKAEGFVETALLRGVSG